MRRYSIARLEKRLKAWIDEYRHNQYGYGMSAEANIRSLQALIELRKNEVQYRDTASVARSTLD
jgi:hypothetical protein